MKKINNDSASEESQAKNSHTVYAAFLWTKLLNAPFWSLYCMLPFILYRDLHASPVLVAFAIAIKPLSALLAIYWRKALNHNMRWLRNNIIWAGILGHVPFCFTPFFDSPYPLLLSSILCMALCRGAIPAWMELLKIFIPQTGRAPLFARSSALTYLGDAFFACTIGWLLDGYIEAWRWLFPATALLASTALFWQRRLPVTEETSARNIIDAPPATPFFSLLLQPWRDAWHLLRERRDFLRFQMGFALGGGGLMIIQGALPTYFVDVLEISYSKMGVALGLCKGLGFIATTPLWARLFSRLDIYRFNGLVTFGAIAYPLLLLTAATDLIWLYIAYLCYGIMQGGSEIGWNLSGITFSHNEESTKFTSVNVLMVGLRGGLAPLGGWVCAHYSSHSAILLGAAFSLLATYSLFSYSQRYATAQGV